MVERKLEFRVGLYIFNKLHALAIGGHIRRLVAADQRFFKPTLCFEKVKCGRQVSGEVVFLFDIAIRPVRFVEVADQHLFGMLNLRGGEYASEPALFLRKKYWTDGMAQMKKIRSDMEFMIVTDDVTMAHKLLPGIPAYHFPVHGDYVTVKNARYLIISNSSFACFPAFTSETVQKVIAPKYWARHNVSNGYWASEQNIYTGFEYLGRDGKLYDAQACREELETYRRQSEFFAKHHEKPDGMAYRLGEIQAKAAYTAYFGGRAVRSLKRRLTGQQK